MTFQRAPALTILISLFCFWAFPAQAQKNAATQAPIAAGYAGPEACKDCHGDEYES